MESDALWWPKLGTNGTERTLNGSPWEKASSESALGREAADSIATEKGGGAAEERVPRT